MLPEGVIYLDGNSLGALVADIVPRIEQAVTQEWGRGLIRSWNDAGWYSAPQRIAARLAPLVGAQAEEIAVGDSTSINLYKLLHSAMAHNPQRSTVLCELDSFPTNAYITTEVARQFDKQVRFVDPEEMAAVVERDGDEIAAVQLGQVNYRTSRRVEMKSITAAAHAAGTQIVWDLCHSAGAMDVDLDGCEVDYAVGCTYKYLNGGPGAPAFAFVAKRHHADLAQPIPGWHGHRAPFSFDARYHPADGVGRLQTGTAPMLSMLALEAALSAFDGVDLAVVRSKSVSLTQLFIDLCDTHLTEFGFEVVTPRAAAGRGSHVSLAHDQAYAITQAWAQAGVIGDFRQPNLLRCGFAPLYNSHADIVEAVARLTAIMRDRSWDRPQFHLRKVVT